MVFIWRGIRKTFSITKNEHDNKTKQIRADDACERKEMNGGGADEDV